MHTIEHHSQGLQLVVDMMPRIGLDVPAELLEMTSHNVALDNIAFNLHHEITFFERMIDLADDPLIGLKISKIYRPEAYGLFGLTMLCAPNLRTLGQFIADFGIMTYSLLNLTFKVDDRNATLSLTPSNLKLSNRLRAFYADRDTAAAGFAFDTVMHQKIPYTSVSLVHDGHGLKQQYEDHFHCNVTFNATSNSISFPNEFLDAPLPMRNVIAYEFCLKECQVQYSKMARTNDLISVLRQEVLVRPGYLQDFPSIAKQLNMSERSLRRRLSELGTSYQAIQQEIRFQEARKYLQSGRLLLIEVAELVGYSDAGTFTNAFKRWSDGISPREYRRSHSS